MTDKKLARLSRLELAELLAAQTAENERLTAALAAAGAELAERQISMEKAGSIAEAALELSGIFTAAEEACAMYTENLKRLSGREDEAFARLKAEADRYAAERTAEAECYAERIRSEAQAYAQLERAKADAYVSRAREEADRYWKAASAKLLKLMEEQHALSGK